MNRIKKSVKGKNILPQSKSQGRGATITCPIRENASSLVGG